MTLQQCRFVHGDQRFVFIQYFNRRQGNRDILLHVRGVVVQFNAYDHAFADRLVGKKGRRVYGDGALGFCIFCLPGGEGKRAAQERVQRSAAASACGPTGGAAPMPREAGGFAAQLLGVSPAPARPAGGPDIGGRRNLMGGDHGDGLPS